MICEKDKCTGCFACHNICPKGAIEMKEDKFGYIYPEIIKSKCINCGLCKKTCPVLNKVELNEPLKCYAMYANNENIRSKSTSGGVATQISKIVIENQGIVYGAAFTSDCNVEHIRIDNLNDLAKIQGSKYVHSYIKDVFKSIKKDLLDKKKVLFIGTPCQVAGLKKYLIKDYNNLYTIDIICHGVPSQKFLKEEVQRINNNLEIDRVNFRVGNNYGFYIIKDNKCKFSISKEESPYADLFMLGYSLRPNCHNCAYANRKRISDITLGDFWGLSKESKISAERNKGINVVICSSKKGLELIEKIKKSFVFEERDYIEAVNGNTQLRNPISKYNENVKFKSLYLKDGFCKAYKKITCKIRIKRKLSKIKKNIKKVIKYE